MTWGVMNDGTAAEVEEVAAGTSAPPLPLADVRQCKRDWEPFSELDLSCDIGIPLPQLLQQTFVGWM
jgi:hypothetical protein